MCVNTEMRSAHPSGRIEPIGWSATWVLLAIVVMLTKEFTYFDDEVFIRITALATLLWFVLVVLHHKIALADRNLMTLPILFYIPYWMIFFLIPFVISYFPEVELRRTHIIAAEYWASVVYSASLGLAFFYGGYTLLAKKSMVKTAISSCYRSQCDMRVVRFSAWIVLIISILFYAIFYISGGSAMYQGEYTGAREIGWGGSVWLIAFSSAFQGAIALWAIYFFRSRTQGVLHALSSPGNLLAALLIVGCAIAMGLTGNRSLLAFGVLIFLLIYSVGRPIRFLGFVFFILVGLIAYSAIQAVRSVEYSSVAGGYDTIVQSLILNESLLAFSLSSAPAVTNAYLAVDQFGLFNGVFFLQGVLSVIPFYAKIFPWIPGAVDSTMGSSSNFITSFVFGSHKYGLGTTLVSDVYMDFGNIGVVLVMFFLGCIGGYLYNARLSGRYYIGLLSYSVIVPALMYSARGSVTFPLRALWIIAFCYLILLFTDKVLMINRGSSLPARLSQPAHRVE